jgi:hypothetical protein
VCATMGTQYSVFARMLTNLILAATTIDTIRGQVVAFNLGVFHRNKRIHNSSLSGTPEDYIKGKGSVSLISGTAGVDFKYCTIMVEVRLARLCIDIVGQ